MADYPNTQYGPASAGSAGGGGGTGDTTVPAVSPTTTEIPRTAATAQNFAVKAGMNWDVSNGNLSFDPNPPNDIPQFDPCVDPWEIPLAWFIEIGPGLQYDIDQGAGPVPVPDPTTGGVILPNPPDPFLCANAGINVFFIHAYDEFGNFSVVETYVNIQDNLGFCGGCGP